MLIYIPTHHTTIAHPKRDQQLPIPTGIPTDSKPIPVPGRKVTGTRTRAGGMGTLRVGVRVGVKLPTGYPCPTLLITADMDLLGLSDNIFLRITHPYDISAFETFISMHDLNFFYPLLVTNLRTGFPLGEMPPLTDTVIFKNHPSTLLHSDVVTQYLTDELDAGRMSGPFSLQQVENILRGPIFCSPLLISVQVQQPGTPDKLRVCRHLSKGNKDIPSMNSHIKKEDFPTRFDTASRVADIVRFFLTDRRLHALHLHGLHLWWLTSSWVSPLVAFIFMGFTSGGPHLHGLHLWWPFLHGFHLW